MKRIRDLWRRRPWQIIGVLLLLLGSLTVLSVGRQDLVWRSFGLALIFAGLGAIRRGADRADSATRRSAGKQGAVVSIVAIVGSSLVFLVQFGLIISDAPKLYMGLTTIIGLALVFAAVFAAVRLQRRGAGD